MIHMISDRPILVNGVVTTDFFTSEFHARELEALGGARRLDANQVEESIDPNPPVPATVSEKISPNDRDNFEREPLRGPKLRTKGQ